MLKFISNGSALNVKRGNNSAYIKKGNKAFIIDSGSDVFSTIKKKRILEDVEEINLYITHTHSDHVGSIGDLVFYTFFGLSPILKNKIKILTVKDTNTKEVLDLMGCVEGVHYTIEYLEVNQIKEIEDMGIEIKSIKTVHYPNMNSYGLEIKNEEKLYFYSGDASIETYKNIDFDKYEEMYIDTCEADYPNNVHLSVRELLEITTEEQRKKVVCMHLDESFDEEKVKKYGFKISSTEE